MRRVPITAEWTGDRPEFTDLNPLPPASEGSVLITEPSDKQVKLMTNISLALYYFVNPTKKTPLKQW